MKIRLLLLTLLFSVASWGQVTIVSDGLNNATTLFTLTNGAYYTGNSAGADGPATSPFAIEGSHSRGASNVSATLLSSDINTTGYTSISMSFKLASFSIGGTGNGADVTDISTVEVSPDGGASWYSTVRVLGFSNAYWAYSATGNASAAYDGNATPVDFQPSGGGSRTTDGYSSVNITGLPAVSNLRFRITLLNNAAAERWLVDDFKVQGTVASNTITTNTALTGSPYCVSASTGVAVSVPFISTGTFTGANVYTAQLSSAAGSFAAPVSIGTLSSTANSGTIAATIPAGTAAGAGYRIRVVSDTPSTTGTDNTVNLTVSTIVSITTQPSVSTQNICQGSTATALSVTAAGTGMTYQWYSNTTASNSGGTLIGAATAASYAPLTSTVGTLYYYCIVTGTCGAVTTNVSGDINVTSLPATPSAPTAAANPSCGSTTLNAMTAPGGETYYWQGTTSNGTNTGSNANAAYTVPSTGTYYVRSRNNTTLCWSAQSSVLVTVNTAVAITAQPANKVITEGTNTTFGVTATGTGLTYQWQVDTGSGFNNLSNGAPYSTVTGATLNITGAALAMNGYLYRCVVSGATPCSSLNSNQASLTVNPAPANDLCANAIALTINAAAVTGNMSGSAPTAGLAYGAAKNDEWYSFTPSCTGSHTITVSGYAGDIDVDVFTTSCPVSGSGTSTAHTTNATETITTTFTSGVTYYIRVLAWNAAAETSAFTVGVVSNGVLTLTNTGSPVAGNISANTTDVILFGFDVTPNSCTTSYNFTSVTITKTGTSTTSDLSNFRIFYDADGNGAINGGEATVSGAGIALAASMNFTVTGETGLTTARKYLLVADVAVLATEGNTFTASITPANLTAVLTPTGTVTATAAGNTQTIIYSGPEINVLNSTPASIPTGSAAGVGYNTQFAATNIGSSTAAKTYTIKNLGSTTLNVSSVISSNASEFTVSAVTPFAIAPDASVTFTVTFSPLNSGTRTSVISIANDDITNDGALTENPYTFNVQGTGNCGTVTNTMTPTSGPAGTEVTITSTNGTTNNLTGATATFNGVAATVISSSATQMVVIVPAAATSGNLVTTNSQGCPATNAFTVITNAVAGCEGGSSVSELFISEITDETSGSMTYVEIYNGTGAAVNLATDNYRIKVYNNGAGSTCDLALTGTIANNDVYVLRIGGNLAEGTSGNAGGVIPDQIEDGCSAVNDNDNIRLFKGAGHIDQWGFPTNTTLTGIGAKGYTFRRLNTATPLPSTTFFESDWTVIDANDAAGFDGAVDYTNVGLYDFSTANPPTITAQPSINLTCSSTSAAVTVTATEGFALGNPLAYQWYVAAPGAVTWTALTDTGVYTGTTASVLNISSVTGLDNYQYYCQVRENDATCYKASIAVKIPAGTITAWDGTVWSNGTPTLGMQTIINGNYNTTTHGDIDACSLVVNTGFTLTVTANHYLNIQNDVTVNAGGTLDVLNNGSLVQVSDSGVNTGNIIMRRTANIKLQDYVYWSSPVASFAVTNISSGTPASLLWRWNPTVANSNGGEGNWQSASGNMTVGGGYIVRAPNGFTNASTTAFTANFTGVPYNGIYTPAISRGNDTGAGTNGPNGVLRLATDDNWNLLGNPYPSAISINSFLTANTNIDGFVRIWTHGTLPSNAISDPFYDNFASNYTASDYIAINGAGATSGPGTLSVIGAGQGFFVLMNAGTASASSVTFNNAMRNKTFSNSQFYRTANLLNDTSYLGENPERHRIWLDLVSPSGETTRTLVAYVEGATEGKDRLYDAITDYKNAQNFYSLINNDVMTIQGRGLPFNVQDKVPMGIKVATNGMYHIGVAAVDGLFGDGNQIIYLEDRLLNTIHNLTNAPYQFTANQGIIENRFILRFTDQSLATDDFNVTDNEVVAVVENEQIYIRSQSEPIENIVVYDVLGRVIFEKNNINAAEYSISNLTLNQQALIVKISLENGAIVTRKIIF